MTANTSWNERAHDPELVALTDALASAAMFAADNAAIDAMGTVSAVRRPDGGPQGLTAAEMTRIEVTAAVRWLVGVGLVVPVTRDRFEEVMAAGVPMTTPEWMLPRQDAR